MHATRDDDAERKGLREWWKSPPRSGMRLLIIPWEYRHLRAWARVRIVSGGVLAVLAAVTLAFGGDDWKTYGWTLVFLVLAGASWAFAFWELSIARSEAREN